MTHANRDCLTMLVVVILATIMMMFFPDLPYYLLDSVPTIW